VFELRDRLHALWQKKKEFLEDLYNQQMFLRDMNQLETLSNTQEVVSVDHMVVDLHLFIHLTLIHEQLLIFFCFIFQIFNFFFLQVL